MKKCISGVSYIKWITDKTTGEFYGSTFLEMKDADSAAMAVMQDKSKFMGRWVIFIECDEFSCSYFQTACVFYMYLLIGLVLLL
jgi:hypothetical protein